MKKLFIVTGEHSGDMHASFIVRELKKVMPSIKIEAIGGRNLQCEGIKLFRDHSEMGAVGLDIKALFSHIKLGNELLQYLKTDYKPDLVLLIDYGGFNLKLAELLKKNNIKVFYYISPQIWASRRGRLKKIKKYVPKMMLILPFEEAIHKSAGINAEYVGHPLVSQLNFNFDKQEFLKQNNLVSDKRIIGIFPGSRKLELDYLFPVFMKAAEIIAEKDPSLQFCLGQAPNISDKKINHYIEKYDKNNKLNLKIIKNQNHALLANSDAVILASGTITLEAALYRTPMVVSYKGPFLVYFIYLLIRYIKALSLPNIISGEKIVEEFLQYKAKPELIAQEILSLINNPIKRLQMTDNLTRIKDKLGNKVSSQEVARIICEHLNKE